MPKFVSYARELSSLAYETGFNLLWDIVIQVFVDFLKSPSATEGRRKDARTKDI